MAIPDVTALVVAYLDSLHAIPVASDVPSPRPSEFIQVRRVGGAGLSPVRDIATVDIFCWSTTGPAAGTLGGTVRTEMFLLAQSTSLGGIQCYRVQESLFRQFDDLETGTPRTWGTYSITLRANEILPA